MSNLVFSAMAGRFPGASSTDGFWKNIREAKVAPLRSLCETWGIDRGRIFSQEDRMDRVYLDKGFCLETETGAGGGPWGRQVRVGGAVLKELCEEADLEDRRRTGFVLATTLTDESYFMANRAWAASEMESMSRPVYGAAQQCLAIAREGALGGPTLAVDNACASFAYAVAAAVEMIEAERADSVVVMGLNASLPAVLYLGFSQLTAFSRTESLLTFSRDASGMVPGECVAAVLLEPESQALRSGRRILGVLRGLGVSSDGKEGSVFAPGFQGQMNALTRAYDGLEWESLDYIECHGTATPVGDATEMEVLETFLSRKSVSQPVCIGSVKTLIGHALAAAGAASLIKALYMLDEGVIPPHIPMDPHPMLEKTQRLRISDRLESLADLGRPMRVGVSSFGFGGANAHLALESYRCLGTASAPKALCTDGRREERRTFAFEILDLEVAAGAFFDTQGVLDRLCAGRIPQHRFPFDRQGFQGTVAETRPGSYFLGEHVIDIASFRTGPKPLRHLDGFKLLVADQITQMVARSGAGIEERDDFGLSLFCNIGGSSFTEMYRKVDEHFIEGASQPPGIIADDVATMMPSLVSGFAAAFGNCKAFHQTFSGHCEAFLEGLVVAPGLLTRHCKRLVIGAGRFIGSPADLLLSGDKPLGEGVICFLARSLNEGMPPDGEAIAEVRGECLDEDCSDAPEPGGAILELDGDGAFLRSEGLTSLEALGDLGEASLAFALLDLLISGAPSLEIRKEGRRLARIRMIPKKALRPVPRSVPRSPFSLHFSEHPSEHYALSIPGIQAPADAPKTSSEVPDGIEALFVAHRDIATLMDRVFTLRKHAAKRLFRNDWRPRQDPRNWVIGPLRVADRGYATELLVDLKHPYFFDHPLDHLPGILLTAGALQAVEAVLHLQGAAGSFFTPQVEIQFLRYAETNQPVTISIAPIEPGEGDPEKRFEVLLIQDSTRVCLFRIGVGAAPASHQPVLPSRADPCEAGVVPLSVVHKHRDENVLIGELTDLSVSEGTLCEGDALPPGVDHFLADCGGRRWHDVVYAMELARQMNMQVAHERIKAPQGTFMNLLSVKAQFIQPLWMGEPLQLRTRYPNLTWDCLGDQGFQSGKFRSSFLVQGQEIGSVEIISQVYTAQAYTQKRSAASAATLS